MDQFDAPSMTVTALTRRCQRIASLRGDGISLAWLELEMTDVQNRYENKSDAPREPLAARLIRAIPGDEANAKWSIEYHGYVSRRRLEADHEQANMRSVQQTEELVQMLREQEAAALIPPPPGMNTFDLGKHVADQQQLRATFVTSRVPLENILARIKNRLWEFLTETEYELTLGEATAETFDRLRSYVDQQLTTISPLALEQFQTAYRRLKDGGSEDRAHAVTSCRRVLKTLADKLYPARAEPVIGLDGKERVLNDQAFVNRLL